MSQAARVTSLEAVRALREALVEFGSETRDALGALDFQVHRAGDWLAQQTQHWQRQVRERQEEFHRAKVELEQRKFENRDGRGRGTSEPEKNLKKAQARLKEAEDKVAQCKRWKPILEHAISEFNGPTRLLAGYLDTNLRQAVLLLDHKIEAVEAYLHLAPPTTAVPAPPSAEPATVGGEPAPASVEVPALAEEKGATA
jgi:hypothetical protein